MICFKKNLTQISKLIADMDLIAEEIIASTNIKSECTKYKYQKMKTLCKKLLADLESSVTTLNASLYM